MLRQPGPWMVPSQASSPVEAVLMRVSSAVEQLTAPEDYTYEKTVGFLRAKDACRYAVAQVADFVREQGEVLASAADRAANEGAGGLDGSFSVGGDGAEVGAPASSTGSGASEPTEEASSGPGAGKGCVMDAYVSTDSAASVEGEPVMKTYGHISTVAACRPYAKIDGDERGRDRGPQAACRGQEDQRGDQGAARPDDGCLGGEVCGCEGCARCGYPADTYCGVCGGCSHDDLSHRGRGRVDENCQHVLTVLQSSLSAGADNCLEKEPREHVLIGVSRAHGACISEGGDVSKDTYTRTRPHCSCGAFLARGHETCTKCQRPVIGSAGVHASGRVERERRAVMHVLDVIDASVPTSLAEFSPSDIALVVGLTLDAVEEPERRRVLVPVKGVA